MVTRAGSSFLPGLGALALLAAGPFAAGQTIAPGAGLEHGIALYWSGRYQETVATLSTSCGVEASARADERVECLKYVAFSHVALGNVESAVDAFTRLLDVDAGYALDPSTVSPKIIEHFEASRARRVEELFARGKALYFEESYAEAGSIFEAALAVDPEHQLALEYEELASERARLAAPPPTPSVSESPAPVAPPEPSDAPAPAAEAGAEPDRVYRVTSGMTQPVLVSRRSPIYPETARRARREGTVVITAIVDRDGSVREARIVRSVSADIDRAALTAVRSWRYHPARLDGRTVAVYSVIHVAFELD